MAIVRPRINDYHGLSFTQEEVDFAIPFLDEDIPLSLDPFLLWKSPSQQDNALHTLIVNSFNHLGYLVRRGAETEAVSALIRASECHEVGLGSSKTRRGIRIGNTIAHSVISLFKSVPQIQAGGFTHFEEIQLLVDNISKDRVSDIACNFIKSFLIDYTIEQSNKHGIPLNEVSVRDVYEYRKNRFIDEEKVPLPQNPQNGEPILLVPKRWLRYIPWLNFDDYFKNYYPQEVQTDDGRLNDRIAILNYNRQHYGAIQAYVASKERVQEDCKNDPLFTPIPVLSAKRKMSTIKALPSGKTEDADKRYEDHVCQLMASLLYPQLDFAAEQSRTDTGALIRDLIFYNNRQTDFLKDIYDDYGSRQIVMELKNVKNVEREHINQINRYLNDQFGRFGVIITRNPLPRAMFRHTIDLWSGQRRCIIALTDEDLSLMVSVFESKQRAPVDVLKKKYIEFMRACPS